MSPASDARDHGLASVPRTADSVRSRNPDPLLTGLGLAADRVAALVRGLRDRGQTVATAESLTGGLVCAVLSAVPGASAVLRGGLVVYATDLKHELAGVAGDLLARHGAVHPEVAAQLAAGARTRCQADWGLGLTGVAGPDAQDGVAPGTVHVGLAGPGVATVRTLFLPGERQAVRARSVAAALELLAAHVLPTFG